MSVAKLAPTFKSLPGQLFADFAVNTKFNRSSFGVFTDDAWEMYGIAWRLDPLFLKASTFDLLFGTSATVLVGAMDAHHIIGAYSWWTSAAVWGDDESNWRRFRSVMYRDPPGASMGPARPTIESLTLSAAPDLDVNKTAQFWSDEQMAYLTGPYHPKQKRDWLEYWQRAVEATPDMAGLIDAVKYW